MTSFVLNKQNFTFLITIFDDLNPLQFIFSSVKLQFEAKYATDTKTYF